MPTARALLYCKCWKCKWNSDRQKYVHMWNVRRNNHKVIYIWGLQNKELYDECLIKWIFQQDSLDIQVTICAMYYAKFWKYMDKCPQPTHVVKGLDMHMGDKRERTSGGTTLKLLDVQRHKKFHHSPRRWLFNLKKITLSFPSMI